MNASFLNATSVAEERVPSVYEYIPSGCPADSLFDVLDTIVQAGLITGPLTFTECIPNCGLCSTPSSDNDYIYFNLIISGVVLPLLGLLGLMGNSMSAFIYSRPECRSSTNLYLCALGCSDSAIILTAIFLFGVESYRKFSVHIYTIFGALSPMVYPMGLAAQVCSVYFTLVAGIDCFVGTCLSNRMRNVFCRAKTVRHAAILVVFFSIAYNIPHCFESVVIECFHEKFQAPTFELCPDPLRFNELYNTIYYKWMYSIFVAVGPLTCLIVMNISIIIASIFGTKGGEMGDTIALVLVVLLFIFCNTSALLLSVFDEYISNHYGHYYSYIVDISNLLVVFNSSFNFVIYVTFSGQFRRTLKLYLFGGREQLADGPASVTSNNSSTIQCGSVAPAPHTVITDPSRMILANDAYGYFIASTPREVLI